LNESSSRQSYGNERVNTLKLNHIQQNSEWDAIILYAQHPKSKLALLG